MRSTGYKNYLLGVLTLILLFNYVDRLALGVVLQDIKIDLHVSDTQLGFLSGIAFALFYSVMGIPIARWADRGNRVTIIAVTALLWSIAVACCGLAANFVQLLMIRIAVAVGEAGCIPPAFSLMADHFSRAERPRAAAIYGLGGPLSAIVGYFLAGWLNDVYGWRVTFMVLGAPGLVLAVLAWSTLTEPRFATKRAGVVRRTMQPAATQPTAREVCTVLWASATFRHLLACLSVMFFFNYGIAMWQPAFFIRSHGLTTSEIGIWLTVVSGAGGLAGAYLGGELASRYAAHDERRQLRAVATAIAVAGFLMIAVYLSANAYLAFGMLGLVAIGVTTANGPVFATIQTLVPERMRAVSFALVYLVANLIGMGLGPLAVGALSDALRPTVGEESLRYSLLILAPGYFWVAWYALRASRTVTADLAAAELAQTTVDASDASRASSRPLARVG
jgi:MFS family permease